MPRQDVDEDSYDAMIARLRERVQADPELMKNCLDSMRLSMILLQTAVDQPTVDAKKDLTSDAAMEGI